MPFTTHLRVLASSFYRFRHHTQGHTTVGITPLDEWSARRRVLFSLPSLKILLCFLSILLMYLTTFYFRLSSCFPLHTCTRWFKYDRDYLCVNKSQFVPVIFEPPCTFQFITFVPFHGIIYSPNNRTRRSANNKKCIYVSCFFSL